MVSMPAKCQNPACGYSFQDPRGINVDNTQNLTITNSTTRCPRCRGIARFLEGRINVRDGAIEVLSAPQWTVDLVYDLRLAVVSAQDLMDRGVAPKVVERRLRQDLSTALPGLEKRWKRPNGMKVAAWVGVVGTVVGIVLQVFDGGQGATPEQIHQIYEDVLEHALEEPAEQGVDPTTRPPDGGMNPPENTAP